MRIFFHKSASFLVATSFLLGQNFQVLAIAQENATDEVVEQEAQESQRQDSINLVVGDVQPIEAKNLTRIAVTSPDIVDISDAKSDKVFVVGKKAGQTEVFIWDEAGKRSVTVRVASENLDVLRARVEEVINKAQIKGVVIDKNMYEGKIVLSGGVTKEDKDMLDKIMDPYSDRVINLVKKDVNEDLIQIDCQVTELNKTLVKQLGINWSNSTSSSSTSTTGSSGSSSGSDSLQATYGETLPKQDGHPADWFKIGEFSRTSALQATVNALITEGKGRILSKPRLVVLSGKEASFLIGGEVPIRTTTFNSSSGSSGGGGTTQENVSYKKYGVNMTITPTIRDEKIDIILNVQINDIDKSTSDSQGDVGFISRQASTQLFLDDKQTIILAGFIKHADGQTINRVPFLSKVPLVGMFFRNVTNGNPDADTEMVISLTPTILKTKKISTEQTIMPSKNIDKFTKEIDVHYEKEPVNGKAVVQNTKPAVMKPAAVPAVVKQEPVVAPAAPVVKANDEKVSNYVRSIQLRISEKITYPFEALQKNWEGTVKLRLRILKDGSLADCDLLESSGKDIFDRDALNTAKIVAPFAAFPESMHQEDLVLTIPIIYNQQERVKSNSQSIVASY